MRQDNACTGVVRLEETQRAGDRSHDGDPRRRLCDTKYFGLRPQPLERYLYRLNLPRSAERVFWLHWDAGNRNGNFCSELPISRVARECCLDESSVTRAYQVLKARGLLRRQDPGRDPANPFCQATALTEVLIPREALAELLGSPNRQTRLTTTRPPLEPTAGEQAETRISAEAVAALAAAGATPPPKRGDMKLALRALGKLSPAERDAYKAFRNDQVETMLWEEGSRISAEEREILTASVLRARLARSQPKAASAAAPHAPNAPPAADRAGRPRQLNAFSLAGLRKKLAEAAPLAEVPERLREITWAVEQGALSKLEVRLAMNVALKKLREGQWTRPNRMPPRWQLGARV